MLTPLVLFFGLTLATAVIAYWSDNLGKKLGKKRISLWGLRPRTTATLLTVASSWGIMLFTLAVLLIAWQPLRQALFRFDRERAEAKAARAQVVELRGQIAEYEPQIRGFEQKIKSQAEQVEALDKRREAAQQRFEAAKTDLETARGRLQNAQKSETAAKRAESQAQTGKKAAERLVASARQRLRDVEGQFAAASAKFAAAQQRLSVIQTRLSETEANLERARVAVDKAYEGAATAYKNSAQASKQAADLQRNVKALQTQRADLESQVTDLASQTAALEKQTADLRRQATELRNEADQYANLAATYFEKFASGDVRITINQVFAAQILPARVSSDQARQAIAQLLVAGRAEAPSLLEGATLVVAPQPLLSGKEVVYLEADAIIDNLVRFLSSAKEPISLRLVAVRNYLAGETEVGARFLVVPVRPAFAANETLASATIDGRLGDAQIFNKLLEEVEAARAEAGKRGVNPPQSPDEPNFFANDTNERVFEALRRLQALNRPARVQIKAAQALSTVEPVHVRFEIS